MFYQNTFDNYQQLRPQILYTPNVISSLHHSHNIHHNQNQSALVTNTNNTSLQPQSVQASQSNSNTIYQYRPHHQHSPTIVTQYDNFTTWSNVNQLGSTGNEYAVNSNNNPNQTIQINNCSIDNRLSQQQAYDSLSMHSNSHKGNSTANNASTIMHLNSNISMRSRLDSTNSNINLVNSSSSSRENNNNNHHARNNSTQASNDQTSIDWTQIPQDMQLGDNGE